MESTAKTPLDVSPAAPAEESLLLHSLINFRGIIVPLLDALEPRGLCEIGVECGDTTRFLLDYCRGRSCRYVGIDPAAPPEVRRLVEEAGQEFQPRPSLAALKELPPFDVYFLDGDHNYYTVCSELALILGAASQTGRRPCIFLHDVGWPCGRRDAYYDPSRIPPDFRHDHDFRRGVALDEPGLVEGGYRSCGQFAWAAREGGGRNGVLTAIEDVVNGGHPELEFLAAPAVFGLGILYDPSALSPSQIAAFSSVRQALETTGDLQRNLERNRLALFLHVLRLQDNLQVVQGLRDRVAALDAQVFELQAKRQVLEEERRILLEDQRLKQAFIGRQAAQIALDQARIRCLNYDIGRQAARSSLLLAEMQALKASESYRLTWPLRAILDRLRLGKPAVARWIRARRERRAWRSAPHVGSLAAVARRVGDHSMVSFDVFDTLLVRNVEPPDFVKRRTAKGAEMRLWRLGVPARYDLVLEARAQVEAELRAESMAQGGDYECRLSDIVAGMLERLAGPDIAGREAAALIDYELEVERQHLVRAPGARETLEEIRKQGKRIVAVSDMYLETSHLRRLLEALEIGGLIDAIYVSSDHLAGKHSRRLFQRMIEQEGVDPRKVLHVGDNPISDVARPIESGLDAIWLHDPRREKRRRNLARWTGLALRSGDVAPLIRASLRFTTCPRRAKSDFLSLQAHTLYNIGYERLGPSFCAFVLHVLEDCARNKVDDIYFIAREGYIFQQIHDILRPRVFRFRQIPPCRRHYVYLSRLSTALPSVEEFGPREIQLGLWRLKAEGMRSILEAFALNPDEFADLCASVGIRDMRENPADPLNYEPYQRLFAHSEFKKRAAGRRETAKADLRAYLASIRFFEPGERKAFVDIGWNGTIQANTTRAFGRDPDFPFLAGYYYGRHYCPYHDYRRSPKSLYHPGFAFDQMRPNPYEQAVDTLAPIFELAAGEPHGTTLGYRRGLDGSVEPVLRHHVEPEAVLRIREGILDCARLFAEAYDLHEIDPAVLNQTAARDLAAFLLRPTMDQAKAVSSLVHDADWGSDKKFNLVSTELGPRTWFDFNHMRRAMDESIWKEGTLRLSGIPCVFALRKAFRGARRVFRLLLGRRP